MESTFLTRHKASCDMLQHVFRSQPEPLVAGLNYMKMLVFTAERLPILLVHGTERSCGRTTFLRWLCTAVGEHRSTYIRPGEVVDTSNLSRLILMEEVRLFSSTQDAILALHSAAHLGDDVFQLTHHTCIALGTNIPPLATSEHTLSLPLNAISSPDNYMPAKLSADLKAFLRDLRNWPTPPRQGRYWLTNKAA